jgi:ubiquinone/menaquinone biosynthesis C-methylase UbiE
MSSKTNYDEFYSRTSKSVVFSRYCELLFGIDLTQDGFANKQQLDYLISEIGISSSDICLDIGCGNGKIANYISKKTNAKIYGFDYSANAIDDAKRNQNKLVSCFIQDINAYTITKNKYSKIYLIDSIYFSDNYEKTLCDLYTGIKQNGIIGLLYSEFVFDKKKQTKKIELNETKIARIIQKYNWKSYSKDLTREHYDHMKLKRMISESLKSDFMNESNEWLFTKVHQESVDEKMSYDDFVLFTNRYLYCIKKM